VGLEDSGGLSDQVSLTHIDLCAFEELKPNLHSQSLQLVGREAPQVQMPPLSVRESLDDLVSAMEPLLQDFLMHPSDGKQECWSTSQSK